MTEPPCEPRESSLVRGIGFQAAGNPARQLKTVWPQKCMFLNDVRYSIVESADR